MSLDNKDIINELLSIEAFATSLKQRATQLRKRLGEQSPAALNGGLNEQQRSELLAGRMKTRLRKQK